MKIINSARRYEIYEDDLKTFDKLPAKTYKVNFDKMLGFFLTEIKTLVPTESVIYGDYGHKIDKILKKFASSTRNLGVMFTGAKGQGKSLSVQVLSQKSIQEHDLPVIMCNENYPGISEFLKGIDQEVVVVFDEFEKTFPIKDNGGETQQDMLGLFDGMTNNKHLYLITANDIDMVSEFIINRPGRFHYHFQFGSPSPKEVEAYMTDKLLPEYHYHVQSVVRISYLMNFNFDTLRAIASELNEGYSFEETLTDLNIEYEDSMKYSAEITYSNGQKITEERIEVSMSRPLTVVNINLPDWHYISFTMDNISIVNDTLTIDPSSISIEKDGASSKSFDHTQLKVVSLILTPRSKEAGTLSSYIQKGRALPVS